MLLALYALLMAWAQPLLRRKLARRGRTEPGYLHAIEERFGHYHQPVETDASLVWVHAVSLGETRTAGLLLKGLRAQHPGLRLLLTHGTATGRAAGQALLQAGDVQVWQPWDSVAAVSRFLAHFKPRLGLLMETEVWPTLMAQTQARGLPVVLVNARLSEKSLQQALRLSRLSLPAYAALQAVYAQTEADAQRLRRLGAPVQGVFGNLKFDALPDTAQLRQGQVWRQAMKRPVLMFASSRAGEEDGFFAALRAAADSYPLVARDAGAVKAAEPSAAFPSTFPVALVVPRHPQRFDEVQSLAEKHGLSVSRRSSWAASPEQDPQAARAAVWLGDSLGEMALYYALSDVALLGGSFAPLGGQNLIEAAACGCPIVMGPHTFNFQQAAELAQATGAALRVPDLTEALATALRVLSAPDTLASMANQSKAFTQTHSGASQKTQTALSKLL